MNNKIIYQFILYILVTLQLLPTVSAEQHLYSHNELDRSLDINPFEEMTNMQEFLCKRALTSGSERHLKDACFDNINVTLQGRESGRVVSNNHRTKEARLAEAVGRGSICKVDSSSSWSLAGSLFLIKHKNVFYFLGSAHGFYENGKLRCDKKSGSFFPDKQLKGNPNANPHLKYKFKPIPLNHITALKDDATLISNKNLHDFVLLELTDSVENRKIALNQFKQKRTYLTLARMGNDEIIDYSKHNKVTMLSYRDNFHDHKKMSIEEGCSISNTRNKILKHNCDTGQGSSGAPLISAQHRGKYYALGLHYGGLESNADSNYGGNFFIPSNHILDVLESIKGVDHANTSLLADMYLAKSSNASSTDKK